MYNLFIPYQKRRWTKSPRPTTKAAQNASIYNLLIILAKSEFRSSPANDNEELHVLPDKSSRLRITPSTGLSIKLDTVA
jgi:hypothetical protein